MSFWISGAIIVSTIATSAVSTANATAQKKAIKNAQNDMNAANDKAIADAKAAQEVAGSQAQAQVDARRRRVADNSTIWTSPMGLTDQATTAKKSLLGA
jgi:hypothetical protein